MEERSGRGGTWRGGVGGGVWKGVRGAGRWLDGMESEESGGEKARSEREREEADELELCTLSR